MNVHHKCQKKVANLCGINQKLLAEALNQVSQVGSTVGTRDTGLWGWGSQGSLPLLGTTVGCFIPKTPLLEDPVQELSRRGWWVYSH